MASARPRRIILVTFALGLIAAWLLRDQVLRPTHLSADRQAQLDACLSHTSLSAPKGQHIPLKFRDCAPLVPLRACRTAWQAAGRAEVTWAQAAHACRAALCDEWTSAPPFCQRADYQTDPRTLHRHCMHMASAVLGRAPTTAEEQAGADQLDHVLCQGTPHPRSADFSPHLQQTLALAGALNPLLTWGVTKPMDAPDTPPLECARFGPPNPRWPRPRGHD